MENSEHKTAEQKKWSLSKWGKEDVLMYDGVIVALALDELCNKLNRLEELELYSAQQVAEAVKKLQDFKDYTHKRLDEVGVPIDPDSPHKEHGCRIGGRLDYIFNKNFRLEQEVEELKRKQAELMVGFAAAAIIGGFKGNELNRKAKQFIQDYNQLGRAFSKSDKA